jgi:hypothetical protein
MSETDDHFVTSMQEWHGSVLGKKTAKALQKNDFDAHYFESEDSLLKKLTEMIKPGEKVAFGGSQTIKQLGIPEMVSKIPAVILDHNVPGLDAEQKLEIMRQQQVCDVFLCSANAITEEGHTYNVDGNGNRVSAMIFGPKKVVVIAGTNKICHDEASAWERIKSVAAPVNLKRLNRDTPCTVTGHCMDCNSTERGCKAYLILKKRPTLTDFSVFILNKSLGF